MAGSHTNVDADLMNNMHVRDTRAAVGPLPIVAVVV